MGGVLSAACRRAQPALQARAWTDACVLACETTALTVTL